MAQLLLLSNTSAKLSVISSGSRIELLKTGWPLIFHCFKGARETYQFHPISMNNTTIMTKRRHIFSSIYLISSLSYWIWATWGIIFSLSSWHYCHKHDLTYCNLGFPVYQFVAMINLLSWRCQAVKIMLKNGELHFNSHLAHFYFWNFTLWAQNVETKYNVD